jgi:hypothetical protein
MYNATESFFIHHLIFFDSSPLEKRKKMAARLFDLKLDFSHLDHLFERHLQIDWEIDEDGLASNEAINQFEASMTREEREEWMIFQISRLIEFRPIMSPEDDAEFMDLLRYEPRWAGGYMTYLARLCAKDEEEEENKEMKEKEEKEEEENKDENTNE